MDTMSAVNFPRKETYSEAVADALSRLGKRDLDDVARLAGASRDGTKLRLDVLGRQAVMDVSSGQMSWSDGSTLSSDMKVIVLNYLLGTDGKVGGNWISYREIPSGPLYYSVFHSRGLAPLLEAFGNDPSGLARAAERLGGVRAERGDASFDFRFFPHLLVNVTVWKGDEEVPASANILFDSAVARSMPAEVLAHLAEELVAALVEAAR